jgi:hypothetical protein
MLNMAKQNRLHKRKLTHQKVADSVKRHRVIWLIKFNTFNTFNNIILEGFLKGTLEGDFKDS